MILRLFPIQQINVRRGPWIISLHGDNIICMRDVVGETEGWVHARRAISIPHHSGTPLRSTFIICTYVLVRWGVPTGRRATFSSIPIQYCFRLVSLHILHSMRRQPVARSEPATGSSRSRVTSALSGCGKSQRLHFHARKHSFIPQHHDTKQEPHIIARNPLLAPFSLTQPGPCL